MFSFDLKSIWTNHNRLIVECFVIVNLGFLALDIFIAHSVNDFHHPAEWIPFYFSLFAPLLLIAELALNARRNRANEATNKVSQSSALGFIVGYSAIAVGMAGAFFHLNSSFFIEQTIKSLVYTAPFVAPLAYAGLGFLLLLNRMVESKSTEWGQWLVFLALGGFVGNFALSLLDHAQNGFFVILEWIPVFSAALAVGFLATAILLQTSRRYLEYALWIMALQVIVGFLGLGFHLQTVLNSAAPTLLEKIISVAPIFAPLLFVNLAALAAAGLWDLKLKNVD